MYKKIKENKLKMKKSERTRVSERQDHKWKPKRIKKNNYKES